jgi:DNA-binding IclR family transcriptional regulator
MSDDQFEPKRASQPVRSAKLQKYSAPALEKGLEIIEYLSEQQDPKSLQQIAAGVERSKNEIFRMVIVLEESGYVERRDADSFVLSDKLYHIGLRRPANKRVTDVALPLMEEFSERTPFSSYIAVPSGIQSVIIARSESTVPLGLSVTVGNRTPLDSSAEGLCLLAHTAEQQRLGLLKRLGYDGAEASRLLGVLDECRQSKLSEMPSRYLPGVRHIAMPIFGAVGSTAVAAVGVPFVELRSDAVPFEKVRGELRWLADSINLAISHTT